MGKKLIITEKPSVARDFASVLKVSGNRNGYIENDEYVISWCYGHLVEMLYPQAYDPKYESWKLEDLPFLPEEYKYGVIESSREQYGVVNGLLHRADIDVVYWAGDSGKEGQTIEENIRNFGGVREGMTELRVWIDSQTDEEILRGIKEARPMSDYDLLGKSGIMRTIEDYSLGINFSRVLSVKYARMINDAAATKSYTAIAVGRVMTCVLGMVVRREREIRNFVETPFYRVMGSFSDGTFLGEWKATQNSAYFDSPLLYKENGFKKQESAEKLINELGHDGIVENLEDGTSKKKAPLLFNLAEIQSECSKIFKISPKQTLQVIQDLYERKLTTYPRTDARVLTTAVSKEINRNISALQRLDFCAEYAKKIIDEKKYVGLEKTSYVDDSKVTDHYAIIPTGMINGVDKLDDIHRAVYELIVKRFLAIFYPPALYRNVKLQIAVGNEQFFTSAKVLVDPGYMEVTGIPQAKDSGEDESGTTSKEAFLAVVDKLSVGDHLDVSGYEIKEGKTSPPKRYTSGNLILAMENAGNLIEDEELREQIKGKGIGTSATRGDILDKLVRIKYLNQNSKTQIITPENLGEMIFEVVDLSVPSLLNPEMSASWEKGLDGIEHGSVDASEYRKKLEEYIRKETVEMINIDLTGKLAGRINPFTGKESKGIATRKPLGIKCPMCGGEMTTTSFGYGCSNYWNEDNKCGFSVGKIAGIDISEEDFKALIENGRTRVIEGFVGKKKNKFNAALVLEKDDEGKPNVSFDFSEAEPTYLEGVVCPDCGGRISDKGTVFVCENNRMDDAQSCRFLIGKIAGKQLTSSNVIELLSEKKTKTIRGFKSKSGKKFDACLKLTKNEQGKTEVGFDFEDVEVKTLKDVKCPLCNGDIVKTSFGYGCSNYNRENPENSCRFNVGTVAGVKLNDGQVKELITSGITPLISGFKSKTGKKFDAKLAFSKDDSGKITGTRFVFEDDTKQIENVKCPKCGGNILKGHMGYRCEHYSREGEGCKFFVGKIAGILLDDEQLTKLLTEKKTDQIQGFVGKSGKVFDAALVLDNENEVRFDFAVNQNNNQTDTEVKNNE